MKLQHPKRMQPALCGNVGGVGLFGGIECSKVLLRGAIHSYFCMESFSASRNSQQSCGVAAMMHMQILSVTGFCAFPKICPSVIGAIAVYMVNLLRPFTCHVKPREAVGKVPMAINANINIASRNNATSGKTDKSLMSNGRLYPSEHASFWVVMQQLAQELCCKQSLLDRIRCNHDAVTSRCGQRPARDSQSFAGLVILAKKENVMRRILLGLLLVSSAVSAQSPTTVYTLADVAKHNTQTSCWMVLSGNVYDFSGFIFQHPGGTGMSFYCGKDGSGAFAGVSHDQLATNMEPQYQIGVLGSAPPPPPPPPAACTYSFSAWSACDANGKQTRTILSQTPVGCTPASPAPALSQNCTPPPPPPVACTSFTYTAWSACAGGKQSRTVTASMPAGCTGGSPVLSQTCTVPPPPPVACTYAYSSWSACANGNQTRTVKASPAGCTGTPGSLSQSCTVSPPPGGKPPLTLANHSHCRLCHTKGTPHGGGDD